MCPFPLPPLSYASLSLSLSHSLCQAELDRVTSLLSEADGKNIKLSKVVTSLGSQLQDAQVIERNTVIVADNTDLFVFSLL